MKGPRQPRQSLLRLPTVDRENSLVKGTGKEGAMHVLHETPCRVATDIDSVNGVGVSKSADIPPEVFNTEVVVQELLERQLVLTLQTCTVLCHVEGRSAIAVAEPLDQLPEAKRHWSQPDRLCLWANPFTGLVLHENLQIASIVVQLWLGILVLDVVCAVVVHAIEVVAALDQFRLLRCEFRQPIAKLLAHRVWVLAKVDWVAKPADCELNFAIACLTILGVFGILRFGPITYTVLAKYSRRLCRIFFSRPFVSAAMQKEQRIRHGRSRVTHRP